ncbi:MAG TPA: MBL fold metallo-hydrolase [Myxococcales bacterium]|jgi:glyoxylase-like metal-dependent hydrolase (beta-lactamase superfamily II)
MSLVVEVVGEVGPFLENTYVVGDSASKLAWIVDPGGELPRVSRALESRGLSPVAVVLTHGHIDHVLGADEAHRHFGIPVWAHEADRAFVGELPMQARMFGLPAVEGPPLARLLKHDEELKLGEQPVRVIHTPGHTPGGICLFFPEAKALLTGDTLFRNSIGRTDLPGGDSRALLSSIRERLFGLGDEVVFYPGHGPGGTLGSERRMNPFVADR